MIPVEPTPTPWSFDVDLSGLTSDVVASGADLEPGTLLSAYRHGLFPMGLGGGGAPPIAWWSPDPRGVLLPEEVHLSRSLQRSARGFEITVNRAFADVVAGCADPRRPGAWITPEMAEAYTTLHHLGWAHSVEVWSGGDLIGGLYGVLIGGLFAAESKFHRATGASKYAVVALARLMTDSEPQGCLIDVQWWTPHLGSLGARQIPREEYLVRLAAALSRPSPLAFADELLSRPSSADRG